jgi:hypothetical protein
MLPRSFATANYRYGKTPKSFCRLQQLSLMIWMLGIITSTVSQCHHPSQVASACYGQDTIIFDFNVDFLLLHKLTHKYLIVTKLYVFLSHHLD